MTTPPALIALLIPALLLTGCAASGSPAPDSAKGGSAGSGPGCDTIQDPDYQLFVDPRLQITPELDVYPLGAKDSIGFTDTGSGGEYTTYSYTFSYIDGDKVFPNDAAIFVGAEHTGTFSLDGPRSPGGVTGGPYAGFMDIEATTSAGTSVIGRLCVAFAKS
jgi:hypothetical protein